MRETREKHTTLRKGKLSQFIAFLSAWEYEHRESFPLWMVGPPWRKHDNDQSEVMTWWWIHVKQEFRQPKDSSFSEVEKWTGRASITAIEFPGSIKIVFELRSFPDPDLFWRIVKQWEAALDYLVHCQP